jgi:hypothetical protein
MAGVNEEELRQAVGLLHAEFPDTPRSVLEAVLREVNLDMPTARRKLLASATTSAPARQASSSGGVGGGAVSPLPPLRPCTALRDEARVPAVNCSACRTSLTHALVHCRHRRRRTPRKTRGLIGTRCGALASSVN